MSKSDPTAGRGFVRLPTAARRRVRQPTGFALDDRRAAALASGVAAFPGEYVAPWERVRLAAAAEERALYEAGGLTRSPVLLIAAAILHAMPDEQQVAACAVLRLAGMRDDNATAAALHFVAGFVRKGGVR